MSAAPGRSLELYYIDGRPDGMLTAELFNWTGQVLMAPRTQIASALRRPEAGYAGVYLLLGEQEGEPRAYVGEGEDIAARIRAHDGAKDWWTAAVLVTTAGNKLNKAHVRYLEARLIEEARAIGRVPLDNGTSPARPSLSEADMAKMEAFLDNLLIVLPAVRVDMFIQRARPTIAGPQSNGRQMSAITAPPTTDGTRFELTAPKHGLTATAVLTDGDFVVQAGSLAKARTDDAEGSYGTLYAELIRTGTLAPKGERMVFTTNYAFSSTTAAAVIIKGRSTSGPRNWTLAGQDISYKDWEARQLAAVATDAA